MKGLFRLFIDSYSGVRKEIWLLSLVTFINRAGAMVLPFLSLYLTKQEGYSLEETGSILLFYGVGSFLGNYLGGILTDRIGAFRLQFLSLLTTGISFFVLSQLHEPILMAVGLLVTSLLADAFRPANMASIGVLESREKRTKAVGIIRLAINVGFTAGPASGGFIAYSLGYTYLFLVDGITCIVAAFFLLYFFRKQLKSETKAGNEDSSEQKPSIALVLKDRVFLLLLLCVFVIACVFMQLFHTFPVFLQRILSLNEGEIGWIMALNGVLVVLLELPLIHLLDKKAKLPLIAFGAILIGLSFLLLNSSLWKGWAVISMAIFSIGEILTLPFITTVIINRASDRLRGRYLALYGMAFSVCHMLAPPLGMQTVAQLGFASLWWLGGLLAIITGFGFAALKSGFDESEV
jgi:predicted MFS family arabinose efflux permease